MIFGEHLIIKSLTLHSLTSKEPFICRFDSTRPKWLIVSTMFTKKNMSGELAGLFSRRESWSLFIRFTCFYGPTLFKSRPNIRRGILTQRLSIRSN